MKKKQILERVEDNFEHILNLETKEIEQREAILKMQRSIKEFSSFIAKQDNEYNKSLLEQKKLIDNLTTDNNKLKTEVNALTVRLWLLENPYKYNKGDKLMLKVFKKGKPEQWVVTERNTTYQNIENISFPWLPEPIKSMVKLEENTDYKKVYTLVNIESGRTQLLSENEIQEFEYGNRPK